MTIAVTAVTGQLGGAIARNLVAQGESVVGLARSPGKVDIPGVEARLGDYGDEAALTASLQGVDALLMISLNGDPAPRVELHRNVIRAAKAAGVSRLVYTSVQGAEEGTTFSPVIQSNRQTEADIRDSGLDYVIGRNGIYIEPDVEYIETYKAEGGITNSAGDAKCGYTSRAELAHAYAAMLKGDQHLGQTYLLHGTPMTQAELAAYLSTAFDTELAYHPMSVEDYRADRQAALGEMMGTIIAGIYEGIGTGVFDVPSDFETAAGRPHQSWEAYFSSLKTA
ncbi:MAG: SDR family oxidoreductase [Pseudomonadota bacterium]